MMCLLLKEKLSTMGTFDPIADRAKNRSRDRILALMALVPEGEVIHGDELPPEM